MRTTEGAFLEMAGTSLVSAGIETAFGKMNDAQLGELATQGMSRGGIFLENLRQSYAKATVDMVTFGTGFSGGSFAGYTGAQALVQMHDLGSNVGMLRKKWL